jgi:hypothetical protein
MKKVFTMLFLTIALFLVSCEKSEKGVSTKELKEEILLSKEYAAIKDSELQLQAFSKNIDEKTLLAMKTFMDEVGQEEKAAFKDGYYPKAKQIVLDLKFDQQTTDKLLQFLSIREASSKNFFALTETYPQLNDNKLLLTELMLERVDYSANLSNIK